MNKILKVSAIVLLGYLLPFNANANVANCIDTSNLVNKVGTSSIDALTSTVSSTQCGPWVGNDSNALSGAAGGYGYDGWVQLSKFDIDSNTITGAISLTGQGGTSGTFSFDALAGYADEYLIALKYGKIYTTFTSYDNATRWLWNSDVDGDGGYALSHLAVYTKYESVPEAGAIALFGLGLLGMFIVRRRV